jgi:hypothetical protein
VGQALAQRRVVDIDRDHGKRCLRDAASHQAGADDANALQNLLR